MLIRCLIRATGGKRASGDGLRPGVPPLYAVRQRPQGLDGLAQEEGEEACRRQKTRRRHEPGWGATQAARMHTHTHTHTHISTLSRTAQRPRWVCARMDTDTDTDADMGKGIDMGIGMVSARLSHDHSSDAHAAAAALQMSASHLGVTYPRVLTSHYLGGMVGHALLLNS